MRETDGSTHRQVKAVWVAAHRKGGVTSEERLESLSRRGTFKEDSKKTQRNQRPRQEMGTQEPKKPPGGEAALWWDQA